MLTVNLVPVAEVIEEAAKLMEDSWDSEKKYYTLSETDAANEATVAVLGCENVEVAELVYILIAAAWNESLDLADAIKANAMTKGEM